MHTCDMCTDVTSSIKTNYACLHKNYHRLWCYNLYFSKTKLATSHTYEEIHVKQKHLGCKKKCKAKKNQRLKALISNKAKKSVNESAT